MRENPLAGRAPPPTPLRELTALSHTPSWWGWGWGWLLSALQAPTLALPSSLLACPNLFTKIRLCTELNLF